MWHEIASTSWGVLKHITVGPQKTQPKKNNKNKILVNFNSNQKLNNTYIAYVIVS